MRAYKLKEKYVKYVQSHFIRQPHLSIKNKATKWEIEVTSQVLKEWRQKSRTRPRIIAIQLLDTMIKNAMLVKTTTDMKNTPGIESVSEFENRCIIEGDLYKIRIVVKKQSDRRFIYYFGAVRYETKKPR